MWISRQVSFFYTQGKREREEYARIHRAVRFVSTEIMSRSENRETIPCATQRETTVRAALLFTCNLETLDRKKNR